jgi:uncharacterized lipoprotein YajG
MTMKNLMKISVLGLLVVFLFTSCAKQPTQLINDSKAAIEAVVKGWWQCLCPRRAEKAQ